MKATKRGLAFPWLGSGPLRYSAEPNLCQGGRRVNLCVSVCAIWLGIMETVLKAGTTLMRLLWASGLHSAYGWPCDAAHVKPREGSVQWGTMCRVAPSPALLPLPI